MSRQVIITRNFSGWSKCSPPPSTLLSGDLASSILKHAQNLGAGLKKGAAGQSRTFSLLSGAKPLCGVVDSRVWQEAGASDCHKAPKVHPNQRGYMLQYQRWKSDFFKITMPNDWNSMYSPNLTHDLRRFLEEVGTDPKEARYWLKQFQRLGGSHSKPFAVVQVHQEIFQKPDMLEALSSNLAFLHRNDMKLLVVHGASLPESSNMSDQELQASRSRVRTDTMTMVNFLQASGAPAHPLFSGSNVLQAEPVGEGRSKGRVVHVNTEPLEWCIGSGHIPVVSSIGETSSSQLVSIDASEATAEIAKAVQPIKVLLLNNKGGILDGQGEVIPQVHVPADVDSMIEEPWCTNSCQNRIQYIATMLHDLPAMSSVVITSPDALLAELFTHHGSGTLFKNTERIEKYYDLENVDKERLIQLITRSFGRVLKRSYMQELPRRLHTIYLSEGYNAVAIITKEDDVHDVPYLDKFSISLQTQGEGTSEMLWDYLRRDFGMLFWRSRSNNKINPWYFKRCEGSWSNSKWTVFWYGMSDPKLSYALVEWAIKRPASFQEPDSYEDDKMHQYP
ncbi:N-acetylglutamate synthase, mitochondrial-like [Diadema setosum]|uniref:N-acetylglutamate synthase, mitochondrial-like n=1 Tax=Diadema setosum TaxID=31175 RepID=UPI003B3A4E06